MDILMSTSSGLCMTAEEEEFTDEEDAFFFICELFLFTLCGQSFER